MSDVKQVKVDNWGIYFLQRLKHFFNRTDYCDLTLQFQDNAQLKVHRLVLNACTEYFELLERTCEMYEDCLVMPDDLQADVVVPIVNFMYTGHLEFRMELLERLYQTSQILNMPVLTKLLESHRSSSQLSSTNTKATSHNYAKRFTKTVETSKTIKPTVSNKRSYSKAFDNNNVVYREKKIYLPTNKIPEAVNSPAMYQPPSPVPTREPEPSVSSSISHAATNRRLVLGEPRPTRYELPEELDNDNVFDNSFCNISYECKPLMVHPENMKSYSAKRSGLFNEASSSKKLHGTSTVDIVECKRVSRQDNLFDDSFPDHSISDELDMYQTSYNKPAVKDSNQLFDQMLDDGPKVTIETKDSKAASNLDHAKIISEVLKKYPHLVKSNKNIKLKILNTPTKVKKQQKISPSYLDDLKPKLKTEPPDYTYETDVIDSQQAAKLIALGAENTKGPWICLICGTPGKALHFTSYYKFRRHLVEVHNEKPVSNICEYCGLRSLKRNYLLHHLYTQHGVEPPTNSKYNFPKCNRCNYIALTEALLVKHKMTHSEVKNFRCNVCSTPFTSSRNLLLHIQSTGHKYSAERKMNLQCIYCLKSFLREGNLYAHLKTYHKKEAKNDGIIEDSEEESEVKNENRETKYIKFEPSTSFDNEYEEVDVQYQIQQKCDGGLHLTPRKQHIVVANQQHPNSKQKILNPGFSTPKPSQKPTQKVFKLKPQPEPTNFLEDINIPSPPRTNNHDEDEIVLIDNVEYIMRNNQLIPKKSKTGESEYIVTDMMEPASLQAVQPTTSMNYSNIHNTKILEQTQSMILKKNANLNQPIHIVVSNDEEYKALMGSNHPILFDNGEVNKTLAVLAAPHNAVMGPGTIDLNNAQSNNMMIIQEDFPMNVTEAVSTENSNIVVVYSHPVDDQNKQFQILTTGGIGSQFVQSSAIITQNFETVTTSAPVMSHHVLDSQAVTTWQANVPCGGNQQIAFNRQAQLQNIVGDVEIKPVENVSCNNLSGLPEVHLAREPETMLEPEQQAILKPAQQTILQPQTQAILAPHPQAILENHQQAILELQPQAAVLEPEPQATQEPDQQTIVEAQENETNDNLKEVNVANTEYVSQQETVEQEIVEESLHIPDTAIETDIIRENIVQEEISTINEPVQISTVNISEVLTTDLNQENIVQEHVEGENIVEPIQTESIVEQMQSEIIETTETENMVAQIDTENIVGQITEQETETMEMSPQDEQIVHRSTQSKITVNVDHNNALHDEEPIPESQAYDDIADVNQHINNTQLYPKEAVEKIQNLTSEWSEDEYVPEETPIPKVCNPKVVDVGPTSDPDRLEESIENIRHEVQNHLGSTSTLITNTISAPMPDIETEESEDSTIPEDASPSPQETNILPVVPTTTTPAQNDPQITQKISTLLNDWDDNDSQEENNSDVPATDKSETAEVTIANDTKTDNIKSLVSDWDDEEEDDREQTSTVG